MKTKQNLILFVFVAFFFGCEKIGVDPNPPGPNPADDPRLKFKGVYNMTQLENGINYTMSIDTLGAFCNNCDSIKFENFANLFYFNSKFIKNSNVNKISYFPNIPMVDKNGNRWKLFPTGISDPPTHCNALYGDSIKICFSLNNILYYFEDGVPYQNLSLTHVGVRQ
ncbi:MAG: hypothetical protein MH137_02400 [Flavobacteriales bacterium]|nr:hypothetical protein [Flavobacteriales bacterium]